MLVARTGGHLLGWCHRGPCHRHSYGTAAAPSPARPLRTSATPGKLRVSPRRQPSAIASAALPETAGTDKHLLKALRLASESVTFRYWWRRSIYAEVPLANVLRFPDSVWANEALQLAMQSYGVASANSAEAAAEALQLTGCLDMHDQHSRDDVVPIVSYIYQYGSLCGAPLPADVSLAWLREHVLLPYRLPDPTDLEVNLDLVKPNGLAQIMSLHHQAAVERAALSIKSSLPGSLLLCEESHAFAVVPEEGAPRLAVYRLAGGAAPLQPGSRRLTGWECVGPSPLASQRPRQPPQPSADPVALELPPREALPAVRQALADAVRASLEGLHVEWRSGGGGGGGAGAAEAPERGQHVPGSPQQQQQQQQERGKVEATAQHNAGAAGVGVQPQQSVRVLVVSLKPSLAGASAADGANAGGNPKKR